MIEKLKDENSRLKKQLLGLSKQAEKLWQSKVEFKAK